MNELPKDFSQEETTVLENVFKRMYNSLCYRQKKRLKEPFFLQRREVTKALETRFCGLLPGQATYGRSRTVCGRFHRNEYV